MTEKDRHFEIGTIVRHFKGKLYRIEDFAIHSETGETLVVYRQLYPPYESFARPLDMFYSSVDRERYPDAGQEFRFEKVKYGVDGKENGWL